MLLIPLLLWLILYRLIPSVAVYSVNLAPASTIETMGEQTLSVIEKVALEPSQLSTNKQSEIQQQWRLMLNSLNLDSAKFRLSFYQSDYFSANAFALPNGRVVVTDELVDLLKMILMPCVLFYFMKLVMFSTITAFDLRHKLQRAPLYLQLFLVT